MRRFIIKTAIFLVLAALIAAGIEAYIRSWDNSYKAKDRWMTDNAATVETIILGNSHALFSFRPQYVGCNAYNLANVSQTIDYDNLLSSYILRMFYLGLIRFDTVINAKGKLVKCFRIVPMNPLPSQGNADDDNNINKLYQIFRTAAGPDQILEPKELERYMNRNARELQPWAKHLHEDIPVSSIRQEEARQLFGLKKYLQEFTLSAERNIQEVHLWKDYLIFATLFGNAKQVMDELNKLYPDYKNLDHVFAEFKTEPGSYLLYNSLVNSSRSGFQSAYSWTDPSERRRSGGGGWSSIGGGGGFSGGGSGGGIR